MKKIAVFLSALFVLVSCDKKDDEPPEVTFTLSITGFNITSDDFGSLKSTDADVFTVSIMCSPGQPYIS
jgi:hypothetical protein